ncbi:MAG TPA: GNAT family N-acetyltransferase [Actinoplanes sp.]
MTIRLTAPGDPLFPEAAELLDEYRQHYGANPAPEALADWIADLVTSDRMRIYVAGPGGRVDGICTVAVIPATLTMRSVWLLRDLYVDPEVRRGGVARALLAHVADAARAAGAHRLSLQTEAGNAGALQLYAKTGFEPVGDVALLHRYL